MESVIYLGIYQIDIPAGYELLSSGSDDLPHRLYSCMYKNSLAFKVVCSNSNMCVYPTPVDANVIKITCEIDELGCAHKVYFNISENLRLTPDIPLFDGSICCTMTSIYRTIIEMQLPINELISICNHIYSLVTPIEAIMYSRLHTEKKCI
jgi:hypothetical protein